MEVQEFLFFKELIISKIGIALDEIEEYKHPENCISPVWKIEFIKAEPKAVLQLIERNKKYIKNLKAATERLDNGTYGICEIKGCRIDRADLLQVPHKTVCKLCFLEMEEQKKIKK